MNVPFPPLLLWPLVIGMVVGAILWRRLQVKAFRTAPAEDWPKHAPRGWKHFRIYPWALVIAGVIGAYSLWRFSAPSVHGRVVDAATGKGIPGALVARTVYRAAQVSLTEGPSVFGEPWSQIQTLTDSQGRFRLPGYVSLFPVGIRGESGTAWKVFSSGYMIAGGCEQDSFRRPHGCGGDPGFANPAEWTPRTVSTSFGSIILDVRLSPPDNRHGDFWGEYFHRLNVLTQFRYLDVDDFVREAVGFAEKNEITATVVDQIYQVQASLGGLQNSGTYKKVDEALLLLGLQERYCLKHPDEKRCSLEYFAHRKQYLQDRQGPNRRTP
jgi:hypothetical protein